MIKTVVAIDVGHSRVKASVVNTRDKTHRQEFSFPTLVSNWQQLSDETANARAKEDTVEISGKRFFVGNTVLLQEDPEAFVGVHFDWFEKLQTQYAALTKAAFQKARKFIDPSEGEILVVIGLPARASSQDRQFVKDLSSKAITPCLVFGETLSLICQNQANAPIFHVLFNEDGTLNPQFRMEPTTTQIERDGEVIERDAPATTYGVIEVGHLTTDYTILAGIVGIENATASTAGVFKTFEQLQKELRAKKMNSDLASVTDALMDRELDGIDISNYVASASANLIQETVTTAKEAFGTRRLDGILVAGGGASLVFPAIKEVFPKATMIKKSRFAVAEGYIRRGLNKALEG